jgi:hypothetical protein
MINIVRNANLNRKLNDIMSLFLYTIPLMLVFSVIDAYLYEKNGNEPIHISFLILLMTIITSITIIILNVERNQNFDINWYEIISIFVFILLMTMITILIIMYISDKYCCWIQFVISYGLNGCLLYMMVKYNDLF